MCDNNTPPKNPCEQCHTQSSKYTCPRCFVKTCSLACVKAHKIETDCNGIRDKTAYVSLEKFSDINLLNDYRYLEDATRVAEHCKRDNLIRQHKKPLFLQYLTKEAYKRNIRFKVMPYPMQRRKNNTSYYYKKIDSILWDITWVFPQTAVLHTEKRVSEKMPISEAFQKILSPDTANASLFSKLKPYRAADMKDLCFYMKQELKQQANKYYNLCAEESLQKNLSGKVVLEHPIIYVLFPEETSKYPLVSESEKTESSQPEENLKEAEKDKPEDTEDAPDEVPILKVDNAMNKVPN